MIRTERLEADDLSETIIPPVLLPSMVGVMTETRV